MKPTNVMNLIMIGLVANAIAMGFNVYRYFQNGETSLAVIFSVVMVLGLIVLALAIALKKRMHRQ